MPEDPFYPRSGAALKTDGQKAEEVYDRLKAMLQAHRLRPSTFLNIRSIAQALRVSPTPVREALIRLAHEDIVHQAAAGRGYFSHAPRLDELSAEFEAATIAAVFVLTHRTAALSDFPALEPPGSAPALVAGVTEPQRIVDWLDFSERLQTRLVMRSDNVVMRRLSKRSLENTRFIRRHDLKSPARLVRLADGLAEQQCLIADRQYRTAADRLEEQCAMMLALLPQLLQSVQLNVGSEATSLEDLLAEYRNLPAHSAA
jgi:DNA-binding GntR family transcriptional regulator